MFSHRHSFAFRPLVALVCATATLGSAALTPSARAKETPAQSAGRKAVVASYASYAKALRTKNASVLASVLAPDFMHHTMTGNVIPRDAELGQWRFIFGLPVMVSRYDVKIQKVQWRGPDLAVWTRIDMVLSNSQNTRKSNARLEQRDFWSPSPTGWKLRQSVELKGDIANAFK